MKSDTYRSNAELCLRMARLATREVNVVAWRQLATSWANLVLGEMRLTAIRAELSRIIDLQPK